MISDMQNKKYLAIVESTHIAFTISNSVVVVSQASKALNTASPAAEKVATRLWPMKSVSVTVNRIVRTYRHIQRAPSGPSLQR